MFSEHIEDSGQRDSHDPPGYPEHPYEIADEEMSELDRGGPATDDQMMELNDPADPNPDDQDTRHISPATDQVADVSSEEWSDKIAIEERQDIIDATDDSSS